MEFILRMPNWLGDLVMATPLIEDVKLAFPEARVTAMCAQSLAPLLQNNPHLDEIFAFSKPNGFLRKMENRDVIGRLVQGRYDVGLLLTNSFSSAWWFFRGKVKRRIGFTADKRSLLLTDPIVFPESRGKEHLVVTYKHLLKPLDVEISNTAPHLYVLEEEKSQAQALLQHHGYEGEGKLIGVNATAAFGPAKCWPQDRYRALSQKLLEDPSHSVVFFADPSGKEYVREICKDLGPRAIDLAGATTLRELVAVMTHLDCFVTNDSGPMHIAAALGIPLVAIFGSTSDVATGPYGGGVVIHKRVECSPCFKKVCPIDFRCMTRISVDEVLSQIHSLIGL